MRSMMRGWPLLALVLLAALGCAGGSDRRASFALAFAPGSVRLLPSSQATVTVVLRGEEGPVDLEASGLGNDLTATFEPARVTLARGMEAQALLHLQARDDAAAAAQRLVTVRGRRGRESVSATLRVEIPAARIFPVTTYLDGTQANVAFLAYQDGQGPWVPVEGQGGVYKLPVTDPAGRFGVIYGATCRVGDFTSWDVNGFFETLSDTQALFAAFYCNPQPGPPPDAFALGGQLRNTGGAGGLISASSGLWAFEPGATRYDLRVYRGLGDLLAATYPDPATYIPSRVWLERGRDTQGPGVRDLDFGADGLPAGPLQAIRAPGLVPGEGFRGSVQQITSRGQTLILGNGEGLPAYAAPPEGAWASGDSIYYGFQAYTPESSRTLLGSSTVLPGPLSPVLPSPFEPFQVASLGGERRRLGLRWTAITPTPGFHQATLVQRTPNEEAYWYLSFSRAWLGGGSTLGWEIPDLSTTPGFDPHFLFRPGVGMQAVLSQAGNPPADGSLDRPARSASSPGPLDLVRELPGPGGSRWSLRRIPARTTGKAPLAAGGRQEAFYATRLLNFAP